MEYEKETDLTAEFVSHLKVNISNRIKRLEEELNEVIMPYIPTPKDNQQTDLGDRKALPSLSSPKLFNDKLFSIIEAHSQKVGMLNYIRSKVDKDNAAAVGRLLESRAYEGWSKAQIREFFEG